MAIEIASGRPSGMDTMRITTAMIAIFPRFKSVSFEKREFSELSMMSMSVKIACVITLKMQTANEYIEIR